MDFFLIYSFITLYFSERIIKIQMNKYVFNLEEYPSFNSSINLNDPTEFHFSY